MTWSKTPFKATKWLAIFLCLMIVLPVTYSVGKNEYLFWHMTSILQNFVSDHNLIVTNQVGKIVAHPEPWCSIISVIVVETDVETSDGLIQKFLHLNLDANNRMLGPPPIFYASRYTEETVLHVSFDKPFISVDPRCFGIEHQLPDPELDEPVAEFFGPGKPLRR